MKRLHRGLLVLFLSLGIISGSICWGADLPDLAIENMMFTPANPKPGDTATFSFTIRNIGSVSTPQSTSLKIYLMPPPFTNQEETVPVLPPGAIRNYSYTKVLTNQSIGNHNIAVYVNEPSKFNEQTPANNFKSFNQTVVTGTGQLPDLAVVNFTLGADIFFQGANPTLTLEIKNIGQAPSGLTLVQITSTGQVSSAFGNMGVPTPVPSLVPNQSHRLTLHPQGKALNLPVGNYTLYVRVNHEGMNFGEQDLTNNYKSLSFQVKAKPTKIEIEKSLQVKPVKPGPPEPTQPAQTRTTPAVRPSAVQNKTGGF